MKGIRTLLRRRTMDSGNGYVGLFAKCVDNFTVLDKNGAKEYFCKGLMYKIRAYSKGF